MPSAKARPLARQLVVHEELTPPGSSSLMTRRNGMSETRYDTIGRTYAATRRPDPRIATRLVEALGDARSVVNIGAGTGAYEPRDRLVIAIEPSRTMIQQRPPGAARALQASAEALPLGDATVDAVLAILTVHHWSDQSRAFAEIRRVARRRAVFFTCDPAFPGSWVTRDYFRMIRSRDRGRLPALHAFRALGHVESVTVPIPWDCSDGFLAAFWRRPDSYLDPQVQQNISGFAELTSAELEPGLRRLEQDLASGEWDRRYATLRALDELDCGYRLVVCELTDAI
jgi:SAM-dependent methyltransferase